MDKSIKQELEELKRRVKDLEDKAPTYVPVPYSVPMPVPQYPGPGTPYPADPWSRPWIMWCSCG